jgi:geranylgeranylglycerol-phosphate geranylgeranyltransferase
MSKIGAFVRIVRPVNCVMMGFAVIVGAALVRADISSMHVLPTLLAGFLTGFFLTAGSMVINDVIDRGIDAINEPNRPIPSRKISLRQAQVFAILLTAFGFGFALSLSWQCFIIAIFSWFVFTAYSLWGKRSGFMGNLLVSICVVIPFVYGGFVISKGFAEASSARASALIFVALAFLANTGREVTKGIADAEGDKLKGIRTLAVSFGRRIAAAVAVVFYLSAVVLSVLPWKLGLVSFWFVPFVLVTDTGLVASSLWLFKDLSRENAKRIKNVVLIWFVVGLIAFLAGTVG